jgi:hypothetical protein
MQSAMKQYYPVQQTATDLALALKFSLAPGMRAVLAMLTLLVLLAPGPVSAQSGAGSIQGTVTDSSGAVIPGGSIHVVQQGTNAISDTKTNNVGFYQVPDLFTGTYTVTISAPGMKTYETTIELLVNQNAVINQAMTAGAVTQRVEVTANAVQLTTTDSGSVSSTLENQRINQIPMNTREIVTLTEMTTPGLESNSGTGDRANGLMQEALEYVADGAPLDNRNFGGSNASTLAQYVDADAIQEVRMEVTDANASFATPATGIITTKSGTNSVHGSAFETAVNSYFGVAKNRNQASTYRELPYIRNEFGVSAGGPIVLPHLYNGRNKSFWFLAFERYSLASTTQESTFVPTPAMEAGDFSGAMLNGSPATIYDPSTTYSTTTCPYGTTPVNPYCRTPFPNNQIPASRLNASAKLLYSIIPQPSNSNDPFGTIGNLSAPDTSYTTVPTVTFRLDHHFTEDSKAYLRFTSNEDYNRALRNYPNPTPATIAASGFPAAASGYQVIPITNFASAAGFSHVFSPSFYSETIASQQWFRQYVGGGGNPNLNYETMLGLPNNFGETGFPQITGMNTFQFGGTQYQYEENQIISNLDENLTKTIGQHEMHFGGRYRHERLYYLNSRNADSASFANGEGTGLLNPLSATSPANGSAVAQTGVSDADFFLGDAYLYSVNLEPPPSWFTDFEIDGYYQDNWHPARNLTLNLGVRYEAHPARSVRGNVTESFDLVNHALVLGAPIASLISEGYTTQAIINNMEAIGVKFETPAQAGMPSGLQENADLIFEPRFGFAWQPFGTNKVGTVVRGGYGRYTFPIPTRSENPGPTNAPFAYSYAQNYDAANQSPDGSPNYLLRNPQSVFMGQNSSGVVNTSFTGLGGVGAINPGFGFTVYSPDYKPAAASVLNFTVEQPLKGNSALRLSWVYSHGSYLDRYWEPNNAPGTFIWETQTGTDPPQGGASVLGTPLQNTYAATATNPYDNTVYGNFNFDQKNGWSNDNEFEANYQRLFHNGFAYQIFYVWSRAFRVGDNGFRDGQGYPASNYYGTANNANVTVAPPAGGSTITMPAVPPALPSGLANYRDYKALDVFEDYKLDSNIPPQHIQFNYIYDLPFGRGKKFLGTSNRLLDELVGGYQIAGDGNILNEIFAPASSNWGPTSPIHVYKHKAPITDCRSGVCYPEYQWFNGYIAPTANASSGECTTANGTKTSPTTGVLECVYGLPASYTPYEQPINIAPLIGGVANPNYNTNNVIVSGGSLKAGGETQGFGSGSLGANPYAKTFVHGPWNWDSDISLYKVFPIKESFNMQFHLDVFNFLNHQGFNNPNTTDGTEAYVAGGSAGASSYNTPRQIQLTLRLNF